MTAACGADPAMPPVDQGPVRLVRLEVTPLSSPVPIGMTQQLIATGVLSNSSMAKLTTSQVTWTSDNAACVTVSAAGVATAVAVGTATITATVGGVSGTVAVTVTDAVLVSIAVTPVTPSVPVGRTQQLTAMGTFSDTTVHDLTDQATWASETPTVAEISNADGSHGVATALAAGATSITATLDGISGATMLTVTDAVLVSIAVTPVDPSVPAGRTQQLTAMGTFSDTTVRDLTDQVTWASETPTVADISNADGSHGVATALVVGTTSITATLDGISGATMLTVTDAVPVSIAVTPVDPSVPAGRTQQLTAMGTFSDTTVRDVTDQVIWASETPTVAEISNADGSHGVATALVVGTTSITATLDGISGATMLTVTDAVPVVEIAPGS